MEHLAITAILLVAIPLNALYTSRESAGVLFINHERALRRSAGQLTLTFVSKIPEFHKIPMTANYINETPACHTFEFLYQECTHAFKTLQLEYNNLAHLKRSYNRKLEMEHDSLDGLKLKTLDKFAILDISNILSGLFGVAGSNDIAKLENEIKDAILFAKHNNKNIQSMFSYLSQFNNNTYSNLKTLRSHLDHTNKALLRSLNSIADINENLSAMTHRLDQIQYSFRITRSLTQITLSTQRLSQQYTMLQNALRELTMYNDQLRLLKLNRMPP